MKIIILFIAICISNLLFGQIYPIIISDSAGFGSVIELPNRDILINNYVHTSIDSTVSVLIKLNPQGDLIKKVELNYPIADVCPISNDSILLLYSIPDSSNNYVLFSRLVDNNFTNILTDSIKTEYSWHFKSRLKHHNNKTYFFSSYYYGNQFAFAIGQILKDGSFKNDHKLYISYSNGPFDFSIVESGNIYLFFMFANIVKLNTKYEYIDNYTFEDNDFVYDYNAFISPNNTIVTGGSDINYEMKAIESDSNFNELNNFTYEANGMSTRVGLMTNIVQADECFYFIGTKNLNSILPAYINDTTYISVTCLDYNFNMIWEKDFGGDGSYLVTSVNSTQDSGCLILATRFNGDEQSLYLLKINQKGNIVTSTPVYKPKQKTLVYPNPGTNQFNIKLPEYNHPVSITLYTISGTKALPQTLNSQQTQINTSHLPKGVYIYQIKSNNKIVSSGKWIKQ